MGSLRGDGVDGTIAHVSRSFEEYKEWVLRSLQDQKLRKQDADRLQQGQNLREQEAELEDVVGEIEARGVTRRHLNKTVRVLRDGGMSLEGIIEALKMALKPAP